jgi:hypothetical protein
MPCYMARMAREDEVVIGDRRPAPRPSPRARSWIARWWWTLGAALIAAALVVLAMIIAGNARFFLSVPGLVVPLVVWAELVAIAVAVKVAFFALRRRRPDQPERALAIAGAVVVVLGLAEEVTRPERFSPFLASRSYDSLIGPVIDGAPSSDGSSPPPLAGRPTRCRVTCDGNADSCAEIRRRIVCRERIEPGETPLQLDIQVEAFALPQTGYLPIVSMTTLHYDATVHVEDDAARRRFGLWGRASQSFLGPSSSAGSYTTTGTEAGDAIVHGINRNLAEN